MLASSQIAVIEANDSENTDDHDEIVMEIACKELSPADCRLYWLDSRYQANLPQLLLEAARSPVINMSVGFEKPSPATRSRHNPPNSKNDYATQLREFNIRYADFRRMIHNSPQSFFVSAAGNGVQVYGQFTPGRPLGHRYKVYPAYIKSANHLVVAALNSHTLNGKFFAGDQVASYSNFSVFNVDIAAPTQTELAGGLLRGTSFAAPYVAALAHELKKAHPKLQPFELKEAFLKSAAVINIDRAIELSREFDDQGEDSLLGKLEKITNFKLRDKVLEQIGPIMHVKSGGPLREQVTRRCIELFVNKFGSIEDSCLQAQKEQLHINPEMAEKLKTLWRLRKI